MKPSLLLVLALCLAAVPPARAADTPEEAVASVFARMRRVIVFDGSFPAPRGPHEWSAEQALAAGSVNGCVESAKVFFALFKAAYPSFDAAYVDSFDSSGPNGGHAVVEVTGSDGRPMLVDATQFQRLPGAAEVSEAELSLPIDIKPGAKGRIKQFPGKADVIMEKVGRNYHAVVYEYMHAYGRKLSEQTFDTLRELNRWLGGFSDAPAPAPSFAEIKRLGLILPYGDATLSSFRYVNAKHVIYGCYRTLPAKDAAESIEPGARLAFIKTGRGLSCGAAAPGR